MQRRATPNVSAILRQKAPQNAIRSHFGAVQNATGLKKKNRTPCLEKDLRNNCGHQDSQRLSNSGVSS